MIPHNKCLTTARRSQGECNKPQRKMHKVNNNRIPYKISLEIFGIPLSSKCYKISLPMCSSKAMGVELLSSRATCWNATMIWMPYRGALRGRPKVRHGSTKAFKCVI